LIEDCAARGIPVISALAAGSKADPTRVAIGDLINTVNDPLSLKLRWELRTRWERERAAAGGKPEWGKKKSVETPDDFNVQVVYSYEKVVALPPPG
jgi:tRNA A37 threonylcarbamoyladenosine dehydratase